jgi:hypothetical protein
MEWSDAEIKLFISTEGPFNSYIINCCLKLRPSTPLILSATPALAASDNLPPIAKLPLSINITALFLPTNAIAPPINTLNTQPTETKVTTINYGRDLATLVKIYTKKSKYNKKNNNFNCKLTIFNNLYNKVNIL